MQAQVHCETKPGQIGLNPDYNMTFFISTRVCQYTQIKRWIWFTKREPFHVLLPLLHHVVPLKSGNCRLTIPIVKECCAHDVLPQAFDIGMFKSGKTILLQ